jgi:glycosyltransferase involved in cell wall biosynthesis
VLLDKPGPTDMSTKNTAVNDIAHVVVVIPAHDEAARLGRLLASMSLARRRVSEKVSTSCVVVADACTDRTAEVARCFLTGGQDVLEEVEVRSVGRARQRGVASAIEGHEDLRRVWIANTDADTVVPDNWLTAQLRLANSGYDAVAGTVTLLEDDDWCPTVAARLNAPTAGRRVHLIPISMAAIWG